MKMSKKEWIEILKKHNLKFWGEGKRGNWLDHLPISNGKIHPIPLVLVKLDEKYAVQVELAKEKLTLQWSTLHLVDGYHHPKGYGVFALSRPSDDWWKEHELTNEGIYKQS